MVYIKQQDLSEMQFANVRDLTVDQEATQLLDIQGLISIRVKSKQQSSALIDHLSSGNQGFFAVITEKRRMSIYWP